MKAGADIEGVVRGIGSASSRCRTGWKSTSFGGVTFVDDSISTTPEATKVALAAYDGPASIALIAGGHERQQDYRELADLLEPRGVEVLVCLPVTGDRLATATYAAAPNIEVLEAPTLEAGMQALT